MKIAIKPFCLFVAALAQIASASAQTLSASYPLPNPGPNQGSKAFAGPNGVTVVSGNFQYSPTIQVILFTTNTSNVGTEFSISPNVGGDTNFNYSPTVDVAFASDGSFFIAAPWENAPDTAYTTYGYSLFHVTTNGVVDYSAYAETSALSTDVRVQAGATTIANGINVYTAYVGGTDEGYAMVEKFTTESRTRQWWRVQNGVFRDLYVNATASQPDLVYLASTVNPHLNKMDSTNLVSYVYVGQYSPVNGSDTLKFSSLTNQIDDTDAAHLVGDPNRGTDSLGLFVVGTEYNTGTYVTNSDGSITNQDPHSPGPWDQISVMKITYSTNVYGDILSLTPSLYNEGKIYNDAGSTNDLQYRSHIASEAALFNGILYVSLDSMQQWFVDNGTNFLFQPNQWSPGVIAINATTLSTNLEGHFDLEGQINETAEALLAPVCMDVNTNGLWVTSGAIQNNNQFLYRIAGANGQLFGQISNFTDVNEAKWSQVNGLVDGNISGGPGSGDINLLTYTAFTAEANLYRFAP